METFFRNDREMQEWVDLFIEKLLTISLLSGNDADSEFYQGRQAIEKIASLFQEMVELPEETLMDGIRQLVEQRLPDPRVIENFPDFYALMNEMIGSALPDTLSVAALAGSIPKPLADQNPPPLAEEPASQPPSSTIIINKGGATPTFSLEFPTPISLPRRLLDHPEIHNTPDISCTSKIIELTESRDVPGKTDNSSAPFISETIVIPTGPGISEPPNLCTAAKVSGPTEISLIQDTPDINDITEATDAAKTPYVANITPTSSIPDISEIAMAAPPSLITQVSPLTEPKPGKDTPLQPRNPFRFNPNKAKAKQDIAGPTNSAQDFMPVEKAAEVPKHAERLNLVLKGIFPSTKINWNKTINNQIFLAQIEKLLIYLQKDNGQDELDNIRQISESIKNEGWKIYVCQEDDLSFPRRLERGIRSVIR
jgi:hypothetical protein